MKKNEKQEEQSPSEESKVQAQVTPEEAVESTPENGTADGADGKNGQEQPTSAEQTANERIKKLEDDYLRLRADKENQAKRLRADIDRAEKRGIERIVSGLLEIADNLEHALQQKTDNLQAVQEGVRMTLSQLQNLMSANGIEPIEPKEGEKLDPNLHMAIIQEESVTVNVNGIIRTELKGYRQQQRILRPAKVVVAKANANDKQAAEKQIPEQSGQGENSDTKPEGTDDAKK